MYSCSTSGTCITANVTADCTVVLRNQPLSPSTSIESIAEFCSVASENCPAKYSTVKQRASTRCTAGRKSLV